MKAADVKIALLKKRKTFVLSSDNAVSTGSTLLNLACTDTPDLALMKGGYFYLVGDSSSGKTWISHSIFAEAALNPAFDDYEFIFDNAENGAHMDVAHYFGKKTAARIRPPSDRKDNPNSETVEEFYDNLLRALRSGKKVIYFLDSQDALDSEMARKKSEENRKARENKNETKGSYGDGKAKYHSENIRTVLSLLRKTGSILGVVGQTRDNVEMFAFDKKTRSGGKALSFYANMEFWSSVHKQIDKEVRGKKRNVGGYIAIYVKKNRMTGKTGKNRTILIPILYSHGIDDVGSCVDYLIEEKHWQPCKVEGLKGKAYNATDFSVKLGRNALIRHIEENNLEPELRKITATVWHEIEEESKIIRKSRYA